MRDHISFFREFRRQFHTTGAVAPSSRYLGRALSSQLADGAAPRRILEVGPGTGAVTRQIIRRLRPDDRFDLVELNEAFVRHLEGRFTGDREFAAVRSQCQVHHCPLEELEADGQYDCIVSGLPLNNFAPDVVQSIFDRLLELLAPGGTLSYFEYMFVRNMRRMTSGAAERQRLAGLDAIIGPVLTEMRFRRDWIFLNMPPAWVQHLRLPEGVAPVPGASAETGTAQLHRTDGVQTDGV